MTDFVGAKGFEPSTSRSRTVRSTGLSHAPLLSLLGEASRIIHAAWAFGNPGARATMSVGQVIDLSYGFKVTKTLYRYAMALMKRGSAC